ncbi:hypothetical protein AB1Y20_015757 [Prymnesium parvum]|uniref:Fe2OG dioxygenase domain-containing protein n=1 Tax=Prymnesium parvum TaxID=97485 RepID=A0AB34JZD8_PRYPA
MANHVCAKPLSQLADSKIGDQEAPPTCLSVLLATLPPLRPGDEPLDGVVLEHLLTREECARLVDNAEASGFSFWDAAGEQARSQAIRNAHTVEFEDAALCAALWERLRPFVPERVDIREDQPRYESDLGGNWKASGLNTHLLVNRYGPGGHFAPHVDGSTIVNFNRRSLYTVLVYLNDCVEGGSTQLLREEQGNATEIAADGARVAREDHVLYEVQPACGRAVMYWHQVLHAGKRVGDKNIKYCLRTDVMYDRDPPMCTEPDDVLAFELYEKARELDAAGHAMDALPLFKRAAKLSEGIAKAYRIGGW